MLLSIAASNSQLLQSDPSTSTATANGGRNANTAVAEQAKSLFFEGGGRPVSVDRGGYGGELCSS